jgi:membrane-associated phospholipid phosphatase
VSRPGRLAAATALLSILILDAAPILGQPAGSFPEAVKDEVVRLGEDSVALVKAPSSWDRGDWTLLAGTIAGAGGLMAGDREAYRWAVRNQSPSRDDTARFVSKFGAEYSIVLSAGLLAGGLVFGDPGVRDTGRDAIEASILTGLLTNVVLKPAFGRERPYDSDGATVFRPFSSNASFPSGHAAQAFTVASVISMRSDGWVVPTVSYTVASLVAVSRVYQQAHFPSDVLVGAVLGTAVGRFVVGRHLPSRPVLREAEIRVIALPGGLAIHVSY